MVVNVTRKRKAGKVKKARATKKSKTVVEEDASAGAGSSEEDTDGHSGSSEDDNDVISDVGSEEGEVNMDVDPVTRTTSIFTDNSKKKKKNPSGTWAQRSIADQQKVVDIDAMKLTNEKKKATAVRKTEIDAELYRLFLKRAELDVKEEKKLAVLQRRARNERQLPTPSASPSPSAMPSAPSAPASSAPAPSTPAPSAPAPSAPSANRTSPRKVSDSSILPPGMHKYAQKYAQI